MAGGSDARGRPGRGAGAGAAAEIKVASAGAVRAIVTELAQAFEKDTGHKVSLAFGTVGTAVLGIVLFREPATAMRLVCIALIVSGILGLRLAR